MSEIIPVYYRVTIDNMTGTEPQDGFVDHTKVELYRDPSDPLTEPTDFDASKAKERANIRYGKIIENISEHATPLYILDRVATGADVNTEATVYEFTVAFDRPEYVYTYDEVNPGEILTGAPAILRQVARVFITDYYLNATTVYDPSLDMPPMAGVPHGERVIEIVAEGPETLLTSAAANITVVEIPNTR